MFLSAAEGKLIAGDHVSASGEDSHVLTLFQLPEATDLKYNGVVTGSPLTIILSNASPHKPAPIGVDSLEVAHRN